MQTRKIRSAFSLVKSLSQFAAGYAMFGITGRTPDYGYQSMRRLYCSTNGRANDLVSRLCGILRPGYSLADAQGVLGSVGDGRRVAEEISRRGFYLFDHRIPDATCDRLQAFAEATPCHPYPRLTNGPSEVVYDPAAWISTKYDFDERELLKNTTVQDLISDPSILAVAQAYLGSKPILDLVAMWWSTTFSRKASSEAAQLYHFDMDRIKFLKFFVYLTDVGPDNGPHTYVSGSVRRKPKALLRDGRIPDDEVLRHYSPNDVVEIVGKRGTIFAADTRGLHKGKPLEADDRLLLQIEFSNSLFGQAYTTVPLNGGRGDGLTEAMRRFPSTYSRLRS